MSLSYTTRPLSDRSWLRPDTRRQSQFSASWSDTLELLDAEVRAIGGDDVVLGLDIREGDIRQDGRPRANARPASTPGVEIALTAAVGPLLFRCDRYTVPSWKNGQDWQHNVRAIALTMQALRAVDRYGASSAAQQYTGYLAIESGTAPTAKNDASRLVWIVSGVNATIATWAEAVRRAKRNTHPDLNDGDDAAWLDLEQALRVLGETT